MVHRAPATRSRRSPTAGVFTEYAIPTSSSGSAGITAGPDGALWFTEESANKIGRLGLPTYALKVSAAPPSAGTVSGGGAFLPAVSSQTVTATATGHRRFNGWTMNGNVVSTSPSYTFTLAGNFNLVASFTEAAHDFNADGRSDILWRDTSGDTTQWFMAAGGGVQGGESLGTIPIAWSVAGTRDFNGDGYGDILWRDTSGDTVIWFINNGGVSASTSLGNGASDRVVGRLAARRADGDGYGDPLA